MILGTRGSALALAQSGWVRSRILEAHPGLVIDLVVIRTTGDRDQGSQPGASLEASGDKGIFVKEIEEALLSRRIDLAVHSLKDMPTDQPAGLTLAAIAEREDPGDALITREGLPLEELPAGARVGTGSPRRVAQLRAARPDLTFEPVRGNVDTRIRKVLEGPLDAVVLAVAGLKRLGMLGSSGTMAAKVQVLPLDLCLPAVGQGALAIETRATDSSARAIVSSVHHPATGAAVEAERAFLAALGGGCRVPVAALASASGATLDMRGVVASPDGATMIRVRGEGPLAEPAELGRDLARQALARGAASLLAAPEGA